LRGLGDKDSLDVRRARAVGVLADPQYALDLMSGREGAAPTSNRGGVANLFVHLTPEDLEADLGTGGETGAVTIERLGAATTKLLTDWLTRLTATGGKVILRPVLDLAADRTVDQHDPPAAMREQVVLRDAHCVFPGCGRDSRACDLDHIDPYVHTHDGGPPGQTRPSNLAPLCRHHHRVKTHTGWHYQRLDDGAYSWTAPTGHHYAVTPASRRPPATAGHTESTTHAARLLVPPQRRRT
ncbi:MAG: HNH endonuclease signature motif containing protein, partial [Marmoricola sp.]